MKSSSIENNTDLEGLRPLKILQLTDMHLYADTNAQLLGMNTRESYLQVVKLAISEHNIISAVLLTGDLVHDSSPQGYSALRESLDIFNAPIFVIPGNHDDPGTMSRHLVGGNIVSTPSCVFGNWQVILLNSYVKDTVSGLLDPSELEFLRRILHENNDKYTLIAIHHPPVSIGSHWIDQISLQNPHEFYNVIRTYSNIRGIICGHVHQSLETKMQQFHLFCSPSTCIQFKPLSHDFLLDDRLPGYRWFELYPNGTLKSGIQRLNVYKMNLETTATHYK